MSMWWVIAIAALATYLTRVSALALLPPAKGRLSVIIDRLPAPLFGALAAYSIVDDSGAIAELPILAALVGSLLASRSRSLLVILAAGLASYGVVNLLIGS